MKFKLYLFRLILADAKVTERWHVANIPTLTERIP
jgi:hypothetical protein